MNSVRPAPTVGPTARSGIGGALMTAAAIPALVAPRLDIPDGWTLVAWIVAAVASCAWILAGLLVAVRPADGRRVTWFAVLVTAALAGKAALASPIATLMLLVVAAISLAAIERTATWVTTLHTDHRGRVTVSFSPRAAAVVALGLWLVMNVWGHPWRRTDSVAISLALATPAAIVLWRAREEARWRVRLLLAAAVLLQALLALWASAARSTWGVVTSGLVLTFVALVLPVGEEGEESDGLFDTLLGHPERLFVGTFATLCTVGTLLLSLPFVPAEGRSITMLDAAFTAVSAVCVTGLVVLDTPNDLSFAGQVIVLALIQAGGLGIMTFSTAALRVFGGRMSLRQESAVASLISDRDRRQLYGTAQRILGFTFGVELLGAAMLTLGFFAHGDDLATAAWRGLFTSISAFCNAGFALQSDSMLAYQTDPYLLHVVGSLIVAGGLSPAAALALPVLVRRLPQPVALQVKLSLVTTIVLLVVGAVTLLAFEWNRSLGHLRWDDRVHNAIFQSITLRTAGFNSIDFSGLQAASLTLMIVWMFIGGSPGGTAGGIKTTTAAILMLSVFHAIRGQWTVTAFGRRVAERSVRKATVVMTLAFATVMLALIAFQLTQHVPIQVGVFEIVSALGTVGLSLGATAMLDEVGKVIVIACMFVGRVGGLSMLMFLSHRRPRGRDGYLQQDVDVG